MATLDENSEEPPTKTVDLGENNSFVVEISDALSEKDTVKFTIRTKIKGLPEYTEGETKVPFASCFAAPFPILSIHSSIRISVHHYFPSILGVP